MLVNNLSELDENTPFRIYYEEDICVSGTGITDWNNAPTNNVQVVVFQAPWSRNIYLTDEIIQETGFVYNLKFPHKIIFTGVDYYKPFPHWATKEGSLLSDREYFDIFNKAVID